MYEERTGSSRKILVIGGTGFVGRHVCDALSAAGAEVVIGTRRPTPVGDTCFEQIDLSLFPISATASIIDRLAPDVIVNSTGSIWGIDGNAMYHAVALPGLNLVAALERLDTPPRLIHLGSILEVGSSPTTAGAGTYGQAKLEASRAVLRSLERGSLSGLVLRLANICGPGTPDCSLLGHASRQLLDVSAESETPAELRLGPLTARRDYVDVRDVAEAVVLAATTSASGSLVEIGRGEAVAVRDLVTALVAASGRRAVIAKQKEQAGHSTEQFTLVDPAPARALLGWQPSVPLAESIADYWQEVVSSQPTRTDNEKEHIR